MEGEPVVEKGFAQVKSEQAVTTHTGGVWGAGVTCSKTERMDFTTGKCAKCPGTQVSDGIKCEDDPSDPMTYLKLITGAQLDSKSTQWVRCPAN